MNRFEIDGCDTILAKRGAGNVKGGFTEVLKDGFRKTEHIAALATK